MDELNEELKVLKARATLLEQEVDKETNPQVKESIRKELTALRNQITELLKKENILLEQSRDSFDHRGLVVCAILAVLIVFIDYSRPSNYSKKQFTDYIFENYGMDVWITILETGVTVLVMYLFSRKFSILYLNYKTSILIAVFSLLGLTAWFFICMYYNESFAVQYWDPAFEHIKLVSISLLLGKLCEPLVSYLDSYRIKERTE